MSLLRYRYQTYEFGDIDIHTRTLRDRQEFLDVDGVAENLGISSATWSFFGVIWDSSQVLANLMSDFNIAGKRILEVGCGIGLSSLLLNHRLADITATDYHPEVEQFLLKNVLLNQGKEIPFFREGWEDVNSGLGQFDLIIGSDLLYERNHSDLLASFMELHSKEHCEVILVDPGRGYHSKFRKKMLEMDYAYSYSKPAHTDYLTEPFTGKIHRFYK